MKKLVPAKIDPQAWRDLNQFLLPHLIHEEGALLEGITKKTWDRFGVELQVCTFCDGTHTFLDMYCPMCDLTGHHPTPSSWRATIEMFRKSDLDDRIALRSMTEVLSNLQEMTDAEYEVLVGDESGAEAELLPSRTDQIDFVRKEMVSAEARIEGRGHAIQSLVALRRINRVVDRLVDYDLVRIPDPVEEVGPSGDRKCKECGRPARVWEDDGTGWCKRHARARGLLEPSAPEPDDVVTSRPEAAHVPAQRRQPRAMTRPFRFVGGPAANELHRVARGETRVVVKGAMYERRGHVFECVEDR